MNICLQDFIWAYAFISFGSILKTKIAGSYGRCMFNFLRNCLTVFQRVCTILHFRQQCLRVTVVLHPHQYLEYSVFFILDIPIRVKWFPLVSLIFTSPVTNSVEHFFMFICHQCIFFGKVQIFSSLKKIGLFVFLLLIFESTLHVLDTIPSSYVICMYLSPVCGLSFHCLQCLLKSRNS